MTDRRNVVKGIRPAKKIRNWGAWNRRYRTYGPAKKASDELSARILKEMDRQR